MIHLKQILLAVLAIVILSSFTLKNDKEIKYIKVEAQVEINASWDKVWSIVGENFDQSYRFNIEADKTTYLKEVNGMIGSQRRTLNHKGKVIDVEVMKYDPVNGFIEWKIFNMNAAPLKAGYSSYSLRKKGEGKLILTQKAGFKMKLFFMNPIAKGKFTKLFKTELAGIKHLAETGETITAENVTAISEKYESAINIKD